MKILTFDFRIDYNCIIAVSVPHVSRPNISVQEVFVIISFYIVSNLSICIYIIILDPDDDDDDDRAYVCNITPWLTPHFN